MGKISTTPTGYPHITRDQNGVLRIEGTPYKLRLLIESYLSWGLTEEGFLRQFPHITKAQYHALLAYYFDHQAEIDGEIERVSQEVARLRAESQAAHPEFYDRMRALLREKRESEERAAQEAEAAPT